MTTNQILIGVGVRTDGQLAAVTQTSTPAPQAGDTIVSLGPALAEQPAVTRPG